MTWSCYANWLHGDERGSTDRVHNTFATPLLFVNARREASDRFHSKHRPTTLGPEARAVVDSCIRAHVSIRSWNLHALNVRTNHVHVVVTAPAPPEKVMGEFKARCTRRLRESTLVAQDQCVRTRHGSTRYLWQVPHVEAAVNYVLEAQDDLARWEMP